MDIFEEILEDMKKESLIGSEISDESLRLIASARYTSMLFGLKYLLFGTYELNRLLLKDNKISPEQYQNIHKMIVSSDNEMRDLGMNIIKQIRDEDNRQDKERNSKKLSK